MAIEWTSSPFLSKIATQWVPLSVTRTLPSEVTVTPMWILQLVSTKFPDILAFKSEDLDSVVVTVTDVQVVAIGVYSHTTRIHKLSLPSSLQSKCTG